MMQTAMWAASMSPLFSYTQAYGDSQDDCRDWNWNMEQVIFDTATARLEQFVTLVKNNTPQENEPIKTILASEPTDRKEKRKIEDQLKQALGPLLAKLPKIAHFEDLRAVRNQILELAGPLKGLTNFLETKMANLKVLISEICDDKDIIAKKAIIDKKAKELEATPLVLFRKHALTEEELAQVKTDIAAIQGKIEELRLRVVEFSDTVNSSYKVPDIENLKIDDPK